MASHLTPSWSGPDPIPWRVKKFHLKLWSASACQVFSMCEWFLSIDHPSRIIGDILCRVGSSFRWISLKVGETSLLAHPYKYTAHKRNLQTKSWSIAGKTPQTRPVELSHPATRTMTLPTVAPGKGSVCQKLPVWKTLVLDASSLVGQLFLQISPPCLSGECPAEYPYSHGQKCCASPLFRKDIRWIAQSNW